MADTHGDIKLTGSQQQNLEKALRAAFPSLGDLERFVKHRLDEDLDAIARTDNISNSIYDLVKWARKRGHLRDLIDCARAENPDNPELREFVGQLKAPPPPPPPPPPNSLTRLGMVQTNWTVWIA